MRVLTTAIAALSVAIGGTAANAAFIVQPVAPGHAATNFAHSAPEGPRLSGTPSAAAGLEKPASSIFGSLGTDNPHVYTFSYTPGTDADNYAPAAGAALGTHRLDSPTTLVAEDQVASGLVGGESGLYNVFVTWPTSGNVNAAGTTITITNDGADIVLASVDQNGDPGFPLTITDIGAAGSQKWLKIGSVSLTQGNTYSVTLSAPASFVSQRADGVMWERADSGVIPEPASLTLVALGMLGLLGGIRRRVA